MTSSPRSTLSGRGGDPGRGARSGPDLHGQSRRHLSAIAKSELGNANDYMKIFEANKDQLTDPDKIKPGQVLKLP